MRMIVHIDGDNFFVSCEMLARPDLRGKPVITGGERGIASAMNIEAKNIGITRGMPIYKIKKEFPSVVILPSNFGLYQKYNQRMLSIARRYSSVVEDYSIDECFVDFTNIGKDLEEKIILAKQLKQELKDELGLTFSLGLAPTKVLAKVASKNKKPDGFTVMENSDIHDFLKSLEMSDIWGVGNRMADRFQSSGIYTALQFIQKDESWIKRYYALPYQTLWYELSGVSILRLDMDYKLPKSMQSTRTFPKNSSDADQVFSYLARNIEIVCDRMRSMNLYTKKVSIFVKDQHLEKYWSEIELADYTNYPDSIENQIQHAFKDIFNKDKSYRTTGITCHALIKKQNISNTLFGDPFTKDSLYKTVDTINKKFGDNTLVLASSMYAIKSFQGNTDKINIRKKMLPLPYMGEVK